MTDYVEAFRANLPAGITFDATLNRYFCNDKRYLNEWEVEAYLNYIKKFGFTAISAYAVGGLEPPLVLDFDDTYFRTGGTATDLVSAATHARAGNATLVDSDGVLKWAPHNFQESSSDFTSAVYWQSAGGTRGATSFTVTANAANVLFSNSSYPALAATNYTHEIEANASVGQWVVLEVWSGGQQSGTRCWFDLVNGVQGTLDATAGFNAISASITDMGDDYYRLSVTGSRNAAGVYFIGLRVVDGDGAYAFTGVSGDVINLRNASSFRSDLGGMVNNPFTGDSYVPTTDSARYLPRVGHHIWNGSAWVDEGYLHESDPRTNLVTYSNDFSTGYNLLRVVVSKDAVGPDGQANSATTLTDNASGGTGGVGLSKIGISVTTSTAYTLSVYGKADQLSFLRLGSNNFTTPVSGEVWFDLANGNVGTQNSGHVGSIEDVGNGWYRCALTFTTDATDTSGNIFIGFSETDGAITAPLDGTSSILIYGAQFEAGSTPSSYIPTSGSTVTRAADTLTIPSANLPWPTPEVIGPELVGNPSFDTSDNYALYSGATISSGQLFIADTVSSRAEGLGNFIPSGKMLLLEIDVASSTGTVSVIVSNAVGGSTISVGTFPAGVHQVAFNSLDTNGNFRIIRSTGASVINSISFKEINPLAVSIQMEGTMTYADDGGAGIVKWYDWLFDGSNFITSRLDGGSAPTFLQNAAGTFDFVQVGGSYSPGINVPFNIASLHGSTFINGAVDGTALTANTTPTALPDLSSTDMQIGSTFMGTIKLFRVWADDLTDEGIEEASTNV